MTNTVPSSVDIAAKSINAVIQLREAELWAEHMDWRITYGAPNITLMGKWSSVNTLMQDLDIEMMSPIDRKSLGLAY